MIRALIADDEPLLRAELRERLQLWWPELHIVCEAADGWAAVAGVARHRPQLVFLDVSMPRVDGMAAARQMRQQGYGGELVFITAHEQHALRAFEHRAIDYLVKPLDDLRLRDTIARLQARFAPPDAAADQAALLDGLRLTLEQTLGQARAPAHPAAPDALPWVRAAIGNQIQLIAFDDIACIRAVPGYTQVCTARGEFLINEPLNKLLERLDPRCFVQVHRASIVNLHFVARIHRSRPGHFTIELKHNLGEVEASRARSEVFRDL